MHEPCWNCSDFSSLPSVKVILYQLWFGFTLHYDCECTYLPKRYDKLTQVLLSAGKTDVVVGDKHLSNYMHLSKGRPQSAVCVTV